MHSTKMRSLCSEKKPEQTVSTLKTLTDNLGVVQRLDGGEVHIRQKPRPIETVVVDWKCSWKLGIEECMSQEKARRI